MTLLELLVLLKKHLKFVVALPIICAVLTALYSFAFMPNQYTATTSMYVVSNSQGQSTNISSELSASQMIANDVATILESDVVTNKTAKAMGLEDLKAFKISVESSTTSRVLSLSVTGKSAEDAAKVANDMAENVSAVAQEVMGVDSVNIIDAAEVPSQPSGPKRSLYIAVAFLGGLFLATAAVVVLDMLNTRVRSSEDVEELLDGVPVIGRIPAMKGGL